MKVDTGAEDSEIFLCADVPTYFETARLCESILIHSIKEECPSITEMVLNKIGGLHDSGMTDLLLMKQFDLTHGQIKHIIECHSLQVFNLSFKWMFFMRE